MKTIRLTQGFVALVDDEDYQRVMEAGRWHVRHTPDGRSYAKRTIANSDRTFTTVLLHTFLTGWACVDHRNGDGLDNRRANLRSADSGENARNARRRSDNTSGFKGVHHRRATGRWQAYINQGGRRRHLGIFDNPESAALAYDAAARELHREFAAVNFPRAGERAA